MGPVFSFAKGRVLGMDGADGYVTTGMCLVPMNCTCKDGYNGYNLWYVHFTTIFKNNKFRALKTNDLTAKNKSSYI